MGRSLVTCGTPFASGMLRLRKAALPQALISVSRYRIRRLNRRGAKNAEIGKQGISLSVLSVTSVVNESGIKRSSAESKTTKGHEWIR